MDLKPSIKIFSQESLSTQERDCLPTHSQLFYMFRFARLNVTQIIKKQTHEINC